ncbi:MAG: multiheme c-type cytochrome, partial [Rhodoferax sp.]
MSDPSTQNRHSPHWLKFAAASLLAIALAGCGGSDGAPGATGATGPAGPAGPAGATGPAGADKTTGTVDAAQLGFSDLKNKALAGKILSVDTSGNQPIVKFQVVMRDTNEGVRGLRTFALHMAQQVPEKDGSASYWMNYLADGLPLSADPAATAAKVNPSADSVTSFNTDGTVKGQGYAVTDNGDGTYAVKFGANVKANTKVVYDPAMIQRVVVGVRSVAVPGVIGKTAGAYAGPMNPLTGAVIAQFTNINGANFAFDFVPGTGAVVAAARDIVTKAACDGCHYKLEYGFPRGNNTSGHFGSRTDTKTCVMCHTPQNTAGKGDFTTFIHKLHMGEELAKQELMFWSTTETYNEIKYPQDQRNCTTCHKGTVPDSSSKATLKACGACHNGVDFTKDYATGGHVGGAQANDKQCVLCHDAATIKINHPVV